MIEKCNFRVGEDDHKECKLSMFCSGEENCILYQTYKKLFEPKHKCMWNTIGCQLYDRPHTPEDCVI
jgi:hypothetical protein